MSLHSTCLLIVELRASHVNTLLCYSICTRQRLSKTFIALPTERTIGNVLNELPCEILKDHRLFDR